MNNWIPVIVILAVLAGGGYYAYRKIKRKVEDVSQALFGTDSLVEGWNKQADELAATPKSVSGMTRIFEPQIQRDFPDFNLVQFKNKAENMLVSALQAIDSGNVSLIRDASEELKAQVENRIEMNRSEGIREVYEKIRIHRTEISNYEKNRENVSLHFRVLWNIFIIKRKMEQWFQGMKTDWSRQSIMLRSCISRMRRWQNRQCCRNNLSALRCTGHQSGGNVLRVLRTCDHTDQFKGLDASSFL